MDKAFIYTDEGVLVKDPVCDFGREGCCGPPVWTHHCQTFEITRDIAPDKTFVEIDDWAACDECHEFIARGDWDGLVDRVLNQWGANAAPWTRQDLTAIWAMFVEHSDGTFEREDPST